MRYLYIYVRMWCFPVNFMKFLRAPPLTEHLRRFRPQFEIFKDTATSGSSLTL